MLIVCNSMFIWKKIKRQICAARQSAAVDIIDGWSRELDANCIGQSQIRWGGGISPTNWQLQFKSWWRHQMETFPRYWPFVRWIPITEANDTELDVFFDLHPNKWLSKQSGRRWFETPSRSPWRHCDVDGNFVELPYTLRQCYRITCL